MKHTSLLLALALATALSLPSLAQAQVRAPIGWKTQTRDGGATTFTPPDLREGEVYSVTLYDVAPGGGKALEAYLRGFAGAVGTQPGQLRAPLAINFKSAQNVSASGIYQGPDGRQLTGAFIAFSFDGGRTVSVSRVLASADSLFFRYESHFKTLVGAFGQRANADSPLNPNGVPKRVLEHLKPGGALVPGIYFGKQAAPSDPSAELTIDLFPNGEYRLFHGSNGNFNLEYAANRGRYRYEAKSGQIQLDVESGGGLSHCYFGRDASGKPCLAAGDGNAIARLGLVGPPTKRLSPSVQKAREAAIQAKKDRSKFAAAPGKGVKPAQIEAVVHRYDADFDNNRYINEAFLLRDGTARNGLPVPPEMLDAAASRAKEPKKWGKWRKVAGGYEVAWAGKTWAKLPGEVAVPGAAPERLDGHFATGQSDMYSHRFWGVRFSKDGRFSKSQRGAVTTGNFGDAAPQVASTWDDGGSGTAISGGSSGASGAAFKKRGPNADREGTYSIDGYTLTLRYGSGRVVRQLFFFRDATRKQLWFEGDTLQLGFGD